jgi:hypothetical protein
LTEQRPVPLWSASVQTASLKWKRILVNNFAITTAAILSQNHRLGTISRHRNLDFIPWNYVIVMNWWTVEWNQKNFCTKITHSKEDIFFKRRINSLIYNNAFVIHRIKCLLRFDYISIFFPFCSWLIQRTFPSIF